MVTLEITYTFGHDDAIFPACDWSKFWLSLALAGLDS